MVDNTTSKLLAAWKQRRAFPSDLAMARALGVEHSTVSNWKAGRAHASAALAAKMAEDLGLDVLSVLASIEADRAKVADDQRVWRRFGKPAFMALLAAAIGLTVPHPNVHARPKGPQASGCDIETHYRKNRSVAR